MKVYLVGHQYRYAVEQLLMVLFPSEKPEAIDENPAPDENAITSTLKVQDGKVIALAALTWKGNSAQCSEEIPQGEIPEEKLARDRILQRMIKLSFFHAAVEVTGVTPPWGALTGIRPAKLASKALEAGRTPDQVRELFETTYFVSPERTELALQSAQAGLQAKQSLHPDELSLYLGIPFCPTRCAYCSFVSSDVEHAKRVIPQYLDCLDREIAEVGRLLPQAGTVARTLYIGGGTPTTLNEDQLDRVLTQIDHHLDLSRCTEYTVEAGRPDTITAEKLSVLHSHGVNRVSVNPQTLRDGVLEAMGRSHTAADIYRAYQMARDSGIPGINMDLIAGLPQDDLQGFRYTMDGVLALAPENITVHTLALKKGARLYFQNKGLPEGEVVEQMLDYAWTSLRKAGYLPYYLYRQKYMSGSLENIGWCKPGFEGLYNICIMEEYHSIIAMGGGGSTKLTDPSTGKIVRITNPKYPYEYIRDIEKILAAKAQLVPFHKTLSNR